MNKVILFVIVRCAIDLDIHFLRHLLEIFKAKSSFQIGQFFTRCLANKLT